MKALSILFRVTAIIALFGAGAAAYLTMNKVKEAEAALAAEEKAHQATQVELSDTSEELRNTSNSLRAAQSDLDDSKRKAKETYDKLVQTRQELSKSTANESKLEKEVADLTDERDELKEQIVEITTAVPEIDPADYEDKVLEIEQLAESNSELKRSVEELEAQVEELKESGPVNTDEGGVQEVIIAQNTPVLAVNESTGLIVLGVGQNMGIQNNQTLAIRKNGRKVARIKVANAQSNMIVANILPGFGIPGTLREQDSVTIVR